MAVWSRAAENKNVGGLKFGVRYGIYMYTSITKECNYGDSGLSASDVTSDRQANT